LADISSSTWSETAASNNAAPPDGWPEGMLIATANDAGREMMAAVKREWNRSHPTQVSTGTANAFVLTYTTSPTALVQGMEFAFRAHVDCGTNATLNINSLGAKRIIRMNQVGTVGTLANDFRLGHLVKVAYDNSLDGLVIISGDARAGMRHISTVAVTPAAQIDIPLPQGIANFRLLFTNVASPNNGDSLLVLFSQNNGQLYWSNPGNYLRSMVRTAAFGQSVAEGFSAVSAIGNFVFEDFAVGNPVHAVADLHVGSFGQSARWLCRASGTRWNNNAIAFGFQDHASITNVNQSAPLTNIRFTPFTASVLSQGGTISLLAYSETL
jgi:hypothetical protein